MSEARDFSMEMNALAILANFYSKEFWIGFFGLKCFLERDFYLVWSGDYAWGRYVFGDSECGQ